MIKVSRMSQKYVRTHFKIGSENILNKLLGIVVSISLKILLIPPVDFAPVSLVKFGAKYPSNG